MKTDCTELKERLKYLQELLVITPVNKTFKIHAEIVEIKKKLADLN